jgi:hypothetical protein
MLGLRPLGDASAGVSAAPHVLHRQTEIRMKRIEQSPPMASEPHNIRCEGSGPSQTSAGKVPNAEGSATLKA